MFSTSDTIVAIATPPGRGGIGVVRLSGRAARAIAHRLITHRGDLEPRRATFTKVRLKPEVRLEPDATYAGDRDDLSVVESGLGATKIDTSSRAGSYVASGFRRTSVDTHVASGFRRTNV